MGIFAKKHYKPGEVLRTCTPLVYGLDLFAPLHCSLVHTLVPMETKVKGWYCDNCFRYSDKLLRCSRCHFYWYCNKECQTLDWKAHHKHECKVFKKLYESGIPMSTFQIRLYMTLKAKPELMDKKFYLLDGRQVSWNYFIQYYREPCKDSAFEKILSTFKKYLPDANQQLMEDVCTIFFGNMSVGLLRITRADCAIGYGVYHDTVCIEHSCQPNTAFVFDGPKMEIRAITDIKEEDKITASYQVVDLPLDIRSQHIRDTMDFHTMYRGPGSCWCDRCHSDKNKKSDPFSEAEKIKEDLRSMCQALVHCPATVHLFFSMEFMSKKYEKVCKLIPIYEQTLGKYHPHVTDKILTAVKCITEAGIETPDKSQQLLDKLKHHMEITYGRSHSLFKVVDKWIVNRESGIVEGAKETYICLPPVFEIMSRVASSE